MNNMIYVPEGSTPTAQVEAFAEVMAKHRILRLKHNNLELELHPSAFVVEPVKVLPETEAIGQEAGRPTDDEMLYWSAPEGPPDVKAEPPHE